MPFLKLFLGKQGEAGKDGYDGLGSENINGFDIENPALYILNKNNESEIVNGTLYISRATEASFDDRYGNVAFLPAETSTNINPYSEDFSQWDFTNISISSTGNPDPVGGNNATNFTCDNEFLKGLQINLSTSKNNFYTISFWIKAVTGSVESFEIYGDFGFSDPMPFNVTNEYKKVSRTFNHWSDTTLIGISPTANTGVEFSVFGVQIEIGSVSTEYKKTSGSTASSKNDSILRQNGNGYIIEGQKINHVKGSEDLGGTNWQNSGVSISRTPVTDPFGQDEQRINLSSLNSPNITLTNTSEVGYSQGVQYMVSFYAYALSGSIDAVIVSIGGGAEVPTDQISTTGFKRISVPVISGDNNNDLLINIISSNSTANLALTGVQVETGVLSTYHKAGYSGGVRGADNLSIGYYNNLTSNDFSFACAIKNYLDNSYILTNNEIGITEFSVWIESDQLNIKSGLEVISFPFSGHNRLAVSYLDKSFSVYGNGALIGTQMIINDLPQLIQDINLFSSDGTNNFNGNAYDFKWYNRKLNDDEFRYIHGSEA